MAPDRNQAERETEEFDAQVESLAALRDPVRRSLYQFVARQAAPVSRDEAANGVGVAWHIAKFHLDRLEQDGLLEVEFRRPAGRGGPGAGRPTKFYRRSSRELSVSLPGRRYDLAGRIMAGAINTSQSETIPVAEALHQSAVTVGRTLGEEARRRAGPEPAQSALLDAACEVLDEYGYEPREGNKCITLANCPFHALAQEYTDLVCGMNLDLVAGMVDSLGAEATEARLDPAPDRCCVTVCSK